MKVLRQGWMSTRKGYLTSLSKDKAQLDITFERVKAEESDIELDGYPAEINIPDNSPFAEMVKNNTVFLHRDEMDVIYDSVENEDKV